MSDSESILAYIEYQVLWKSSCICHIVLACLISAVSRKSLKGGVTEISGIRGNARNTGGTLLTHGLLGRIEKLL